MHKNMRLARTAGWWRSLLISNWPSRENSRSFHSHRWSSAVPGLWLDMLEPRMLLSGAEIFVTNFTAGTVGEYTTSGTTVNAALVSGLDEPIDAAVSGSDLFVLNAGSGTIGEYTTSGATVNAALIAGLTSPEAIAASGSNLFVASDGGTVGEFTTSGATINPALIIAAGSSQIFSIVVSGSNLFLTGDASNGRLGEYTTSGATVNAALGPALGFPTAIAVSGSDLFVAAPDAGTIGEFTTSGTTVNASLVSALDSPDGIAVSGSDMFVTDQTAGTIGEYTTSGATVNATLISGLSNPVAIAVGSAAITSTTTILSSTNPSGLGASVTFTATVANFGAVPTGSVTFLDGVTPIGDGVLDGTGTATLSVSDLTVGTHSITASYPGDPNNLANVSAALTQDVIQPKSLGILDPNFAVSGVASNDIGFTATSGLAVQPDGKSVIAGIIGSPGSEVFGLTRYNTDGSVDAAFAGGGVATASFGGPNDSPTSVLLLPAGQILVAGTSTVDSGGSEFGIAMFDTNGDLDPSFGGGTGKVLTSFAAGSTDVATAVIPGLGGEFFVVGSSTAGVGTDFAIAAYNADGTPATGFNGSGRELLDFSGGNDSANAAVVQPNGELVVAGSTQNISSGVTSIAMARLLSNGALDSHFGTKGQVVTNLRGLDDEATSVALAPKGVIVVGGESATGSFAAGTLAADFAVLRYTSAGKTDHTFNRSGFVITSFGEDAAVTKVLVQSDGEIVASGKTAAGFSSGSLANLGIGVAEYTTKGTLDPAFNGGKTLITLTGSGATTSLQRPSLLTPSDAEDTLRQQFEAFLSSAQGIIATTPGGDLAVAGNSGGFTEVGQLVAIGIDLAASLVAKLPAALKVGAFVSVTINVTEDGSTSASDMVSVELFLSGSSSVAAGDARVFFKPQTLKLKQRQAKSYRIRVKVPGGLTAGAYDFVAEVDSDSQADLNPLNNIAFKGPVQIP